MANFREHLKECLNSIEQQLITKHEAYGDITDFQTVFSKSTALERMRISLDDKINRIRNQQDDEDEDVEMDLIGYLVLLRIAKKRMKAS